MSGETVICNIHLIPYPLVERERRSRESVRVSACRCGVLVVLVVVRMLGCGG